MPNINLGYTAREVIDMLKAYTGNQSSNFVDYISNELALAEFRYCKGHDWSFLYKTNLPLTVATGTDEYDLNVTSLGYYMSASDIISIRDTANNRTIQKTTVDDIRRRDPDASDGSTSAGIRLWAPAGDNRIMVWPKIFSTTTLRIDGKVTPFVFPQLAVSNVTYTGVAANYSVSVSHINPGIPSASLSVSVSGDAVLVSLSTDENGTLSSTGIEIAAAIAASAAASALVYAESTSAAVVSAASSTILPKYFAIPYRYQDAYIEYLKGQALDRENDSRANNQKATAKALRDQDIEDDLSNLGDTVLPRIKGQWEQAMDGASNDMNQAYDLWAFYGD